LQNPQHALSRTLLPIVSFIEGIIANEPTYLNSKRLALGPNFCCAGQVVLGEFKSIETALTSPQIRTWRLGTTVLDANHAPNQDVGSRNVFLLSLSDQASDQEADQASNQEANQEANRSAATEAAGISDHAAFRRCMQTYILNEASVQRQHDPTIQQLLDQLAADYLSMPHQAGGEFFTTDRQGLMGFMVRYLHYVLFGLDPANQEAMNLLTELYYTRLSPLHYIVGIGSLLQRFNLKGHADLPQLIEQAATIYENSPALANFEPGRPEYNGMTRRELAKLMTAIMGIAALQGPLHLAYTAMGYRPLPAYQGQQTASLDLTQHWDKLDLDNREAVRLYLLECARLWAPVSATHHIAAQPFTVKLAGKEQTFPAGTKLLIPMSLGLLDENFWGDTTYEFDAQRPNLCPFHMGFHSVGDRSAGRICPGRDLALDMLVDVISTLGKVRRSSARKAPNLSEVTNHPEQPA
jgi:hypothetical protein